MITEDYVSFQTAKLLKEKGFDEPCQFLYFSKYKQDGDFVGNFNAKKNSEINEASYSAPTLQVARKWIKEKYKRHIEVRITNNSISDMVNVIRYYWIIFDAETARWMDESTIYKTDGFDTEEQAYESALRHILENIENYDENNERKKRD